MLACGSFFFFSRSFFRLPKVVPVRLLLQHGRMQRAEGCMRTASAGAGGWRAHPPATGHQRGPRVGLAQCRRQARQQSNEAAYARCAATANRPDQRATQALMADGRRCAGTASARWRAKSRRPNLPPTSTPTTTSRQRRAYRASSSSGYVSRRLRLAAASTQWPGSAPRFGAGVVNSSGQGGGANPDAVKEARARRSDCRVSGAGEPPLECRRAHARRQDPERL